MAIKRQDKNGNYRIVDPVTGEFLDEPLTHNVGQIPHQTSYTMQGKVIDQDEVGAEIIETNGETVLSDDDAQIKQYIKEAISIDNLVETFNENSHLTLLKLLALQDNKHPLKKGGVGIAYRTDALIMNCKMEFSTDENIVFDAILGTMSSFPDDKTYRIEPSDFFKFSKYSDEKYLYAIFRSGTEKLKNRHLLFEDLGPDGEDEIIVPWFNILRYHKGKKGETAYIEFAPSDFFKDLALCSQLVHGAYGALEVTTQLQGKYTIALYWYLENKKNYKEYPTATPGVFNISLDELKHQFSIPQSYKKADIERRVLKPAYESINAVPECDFTFEYKPILAHGVTQGYSFLVTKKNYIEASSYKIEDIVEESVEDDLFNEIKTIIVLSKLNFTDDDIKKITDAARRNNKDSSYMMEVITAFKKRFANDKMESITDCVGYICKMIVQGTSFDYPGNRKQNNSFNNFEQRDDDMDIIEKKLLGN